MKLDIDEKIKKYWTGEESAHGFRIFLIVFPMYEHYKE